MPELPEIETVKLQLNRVLPGKIIEKIEILKQKSFIGNKEMAEGKRVIKVERRAKLLLIDLDGDVTLAMHFKMTGQLVWEPDDNYQLPITNYQTNSDEQISNLKGRIVGGHPTRDFTGELPSKHTRVIFHLSDPPSHKATDGRGGGTLYFNDQRIFGWVMVGDKFTIYNLQFLKNLGPEPINITEEEFEKLISGRKKPIKLVLMDQSIISGVGNIYANDALWEAKISPRRLANSLRKQQYKNLFEAVNKALWEGIKYGGATAADAKYIDLHGMGGHYQEHFRVYGREGEPCLRNDDGIIHKYAMGGRGTYFCPKCQK